MLPRRTKTGRLVRKRWLAVLAFATFLAFLSLGFRFSLIYEWIPVADAVHWVERAKGNVWLVLAFYVFFSIGVMVMPITLFPIVGGVLAPFWLALPLNLTAATIGAWFSFRVGRVVGRQAIEPFLRGNLKAIDALAGSRGFRTVFLLRIVGIPPYVVANYGLGLSAVRNRDFILGTLTGVLPWMCLITYMSTSLWQAVLTGGEKGLANALIKAGAPLGILSGTVMVVVAVMWYMKRRREQAAHSNL
jgi:uncharacterized membrane protein YdjX (TVP38/TMEM64 family)